MIYMHPLLIELCIIVYENDWITVWSPGFTIVFILSINIILILIITLMYNNCCLNVSYYCIKILVCYCSKFIYKVKYAKSVSNI